MKAMKVWVDGLLAVIGIGVVLPSRSSLLATSVSVLTCTGFAPVALGDSKSEEFLEKVSVMNRTQSVDCQKRFTMFQTNSMYQVACFGPGST